MPYKPRPEFEKVLEILRAKTPERVVYEEIIENEFDYGTLYFKLKDKSYYLYIQPKNALDETYRTHLYEVLRHKSRYKIDQGRIGFQDPEQLYKHIKGL